ncbi:MAG: type I methionyl aminopeptidase [Bdellovibrionales bacterium]|nr:type I methionyl aminopeptidase [Bdellovibrionales bacterium]
MTPKTANDIRKMEEAGRLAAEALAYTGKFVKAGITTDELDKIANDFILSKDAISACIGYHGYPKAICTSINEVICHGVPGKRILKAGDIINIDITVIKNGFHGDTSSMFPVGEISERAKALMECAYGAREAGIEAAIAGNCTGDIGFAVDKYVTRKGFFAVREIGGHGIGRIFHEDPFVPSFGKKGKGPKLVKFGTITVEPMVNETGAPIRELEIPGSEITEFVTSDGKWSAQYEHTILITDGKPQILTQI